MSVDVTEQSLERPGSFKNPIRLRKLLIYGSVVLFAACSTAVYLNFPAEEIRPRLLQGLSLDRRYENQFDIRVKELFPVGSSATALASELWLQGFQLELPEYPETGFRRAFTPPFRNFICQGVHAGVEWSVDENGALRSVRGFFPAFVCL